MRTGIFLNNFPILALRFTHPQFPRFVFIEALENQPKSAIFRLGQVTTYLNRLFPTNHFRPHVCRKDSKSRFGLGIEQNSPKD